MAHRSQPETAIRGHPASPLMGKQSAGAIAFRNAGEWLTADSLAFFVQRCRVLSNVVWPVLPLGKCNTMHMQLEHVHAFHVQML